MEEMGNKKKIVRVATVPLSLRIFIDEAVVPLMEKYEVVLVSSPGEDLEYMHTKYGVRTVAVPMARDISLMKDLRSLVQLVVLLWKEKPYMVHSMTPKAGLLCMMAAWMARVPRRLHTFTGLVWPTATGMRRRILMLTDRITCACATHVIPEGEGVKSDLQACITRKPMKVLGYGNVRGVDLDFWKLTKELKDEAVKCGLKDESVFTFLFVGRLVGDKGLNELVEAFRKMVSTGTMVRLLMVGINDDNKDPLTEVTWDSIKTTPEIVSVGSVWGRDILKYYAASDCLVLPSYREGFPNTVLEAGAMGLPCIVTDVNGSREIICDEVVKTDRVNVCRNGIVVPPKDADALYDAMKRMVEDKDMRSMMCGNARRMIESRYEQSFVRNCLFDFYDEICNG